MTQLMRQGLGIALGKMAQQGRRPENLAFIPAATLASFWLWGEEGLILAALGLPLVMLIAGAFRYMPDRVAAPAPGAPRAVLIHRMEDEVLTALREGKTTACLVLHLDEVAPLVDRHGHGAHGEILQQTLDRLRSVLRNADHLARLEGDCFAVALHSIRHADLESVLQVAARLQSAVAGPIIVDATRIYVTASVGFCLLGRAPAATGRALLEAAELAADDARKNGPGAIRAFSPELQRQRANRGALRADLEGALEQGQILPWFQPQISAKTGEITGFEALARWQHPRRGLIAPAEFLPLIEQAGLAERLGEVILYRALTALAAWDAADLGIPAVAVNFSAEQLRNPRLPELLKWELDRFDLTPDRLCIEVLETVVANTDNDVIVRNIAALADLGCGVDLDDFGTGHAAIASIRRLAISRIKIDRSFISHVDSDPEQQRMVTAILSMADRLGLATVAEGVETSAEHELLTQLGCGHVQGFGIARPMPFADTVVWVAAQRARSAGPPRIGRHAV